MKECVILAGGKGLRLRGDTIIPKPFLIIREGETLLDSQVLWLIGHDFEHIILSTSRENFKYMRTNYGKYLNMAAIDISIEEENLGTGGGLMKALEMVEEETFYCMNVDDVVFYSPTKLYTASKGRCAVLVQKAKLPFGTVIFDNKNLIHSFQEKPQTDMFVSCGHYVFTKSLLRDILPELGDIEQTTLKTLAKNQVLFAYPLEGRWITINTYKDLLNIQKDLDTGKVKGEE
jgi:D-glycero-alpha-D-manno-heptose 1-phosphate guanylyltransferase